MSEPLILVDHDTQWKARFAQEAEQLRLTLGSHLLFIEHIGSTAIPNILAKPIIDMLGVVASFAIMPEIAARLCGLGYVDRQENGITGRRFFQRPDCHLHLFLDRSDAVERHLAFRDFLIANPAKAQAYSAIKACLRAESDMTRATYQERKAPLVCSLEAEARQWAGKNDRKTVSQHRK